MRLSSAPQFLAVVAGILTASHVDLEVEVLVVTAICAAVAMFCFEGLRGVFRVLMFFALAATIHTCQRPPKIPLQVALDMNITISEEGFLRMSHRTYTAEATVENLSPFMVEVRTPAEFVMHRGDNFNIRAKIHPFSSDDTPYSRNRERLGYRGIVRATPRNVTDFTTANRPLLQQRILESVYSIIPPSKGRAVALAIGIGYRGEIDPTTTATFNICGLSHLLAVSGLHVGIVLLLLSALFRPFCLVWRGFELRIAMTLISIWIYVWMCGMAPSAVRAATLFSVVLISKLFADRVSLLNSLIWALTIMLLIHPAHLYDVGLQLSAIAVASISLYAVPLIRIARGNNVIINELIVMMSVSMIATITLQPLVAMTFGNISFWAIFLNPIAIFLGNTALALILISAALPMPFQNYLAELSTLCSDLLIWIAEQSSKLGFGYADVQVDGATVAAIYAAIAIATLFLAGFRRCKGRNLEDI